MIIVNAKSRKLALCLTTILYSGLIAPALAQTASAPPVLPAGLAPIRSPVDENSVNIGNGRIETSIIDLAVGPAGSGGL